MMAISRVSGAALRALLLVLALTLACRSNGLHAQDFGLGGEGPIEVQADEGIEWRRDERIIIARGNARASRGESSVAADRLTAYYRETGGKQEIHRFEAEGNVEIVSKARTMYGSRAEYEADRDTVILYGDPVRIVTPTERLVASESVELQRGENRAVARGDVRVERGDQRLRADTVTARYEEGAAGELSIREVEADGNVLLSTPSEIVRARHGTYDVQREVAMLTGSVKITRGKNQLNGDTAEVNLATGISTLRSASGAAGSGRVRALLFPEGARDAPASRR